MSFTTKHKNYSCFFMKIQSLGNKNKHKVVEVFTNVVLLTYAQIQTYINSQTYIISWLTNQLSNKALLVNTKQLRQNTLDFIQINNKQNQETMIRRLKLIINWIHEFCCSKVHLSFSKIVTSNFSPH